MWSLPLATTLFPMPPVSWLSIWVRDKDNMKTEPQWWISSSCPSLSWSGRRDQWGSRSPGDHFDDWQWSFWWFTMIFVVTDDDLGVEVTWLIILMIEDDHFGNWRWSLYTAHLADQAVLRVKRISRASWLDRLEVHTAHLGLGEEPWSRSWNYHRAILIMIQRLFSPTILFLVWWHVCTPRIPPLPPCMCTPPCQT